VTAHRFAGRSAIVTGGARGIGRAVAGRLADEGAAVGIVDLDAAAVDGAVASLRVGGAAAAGATADVSDEDAATAAIGDLVTALGGVDVLVTMAGVYPWVPFEAMSADVLRRVLDVNLVGTLTAVLSVLPHMRTARYGRIVTVGSGTFLIGAPPQSAYIASKAGVVGLTRSLANEGGPDGITANCVLPGLIETEHLKEQHDGADELFAHVVPSQAVPRRGRPADVSAAVAYLASEEAGFVTGQSLLVGGGDRFL